MIDKTITDIFLVPLLKIDKIKLKNNEYIHGYIRDVNREEYEDGYIHLLFKPKNLDRFKEFVDEERIRTSRLTDDHDYPGGFVVLVYQLPKGLEDDIKLVKEGKYSKTSKKFQNLMPKTVKKKNDKGVYEDVDTLQVRIFNKTTDIKLTWEERIGQGLKEEYEVWPIWEDYKETLNINNIK